MAVTQRGNSFLWRLKLKGWERRKQHTFKTFEEAEAHELRTIADHKLGKPYQPPTDTDSKAAKANTIMELVEHINVVQWSQQASATREGAPWHKHPQYRAAQEFANWIGPKVSVTDALTSEKVDEYVLHRRAKGNGTSTIKHHLSAISVLVGKAAARRHIHFFKMPKQTASAGESTERKVFTPEQEKQIIATTLMLGRSDLVHLWIALRKTAIRPIELGKLPWTDITPTRIRVHKSIAKNKKTRDIPLFKEARAAVEAMRELYPNSNGPFEWMRGKARYRKVLAFWTLMRTHLTWLGDPEEGKGFVPYSFRHTCITEWANDRRYSEKGLPHIWAGHSLAVHNTYVHQIDNRDDFEALVAEADQSPRALMAQITRLQAQLAELGPKQ